MCAGHFGCPVLFTNELCFLCEFKAIYVGIIRQIVSKNRQKILVLCILNKMEPVSRGQKPPKNIFEKVKRDSNHTCISHISQSACLELLIPFFTFSRLLMDEERGRDPQLGNVTK